MPLYIDLTFICLWDVIIRCNVYHGSSVQLGTIRSRQSQVLYSVVLLLYWLIQQNRLMENGHKGGWEGACRHSGRANDWVSQCFLWKNSPCMLFLPMFNYTLCLYLVSSSQTWFVPFIFDSNLKRTSWSNVSQTSKSPNVAVSKKAIHANSHV